MTTRDDLRMTASEIAAFEAVLPEIEEREAKATDGPWEHGRTDLVSYDGRTGNQELYVYRPGDAAHDEDIRVLGGADPVADGVFIAHARLDVPALLRYARTLKARLAEARTALSLNARVHGGPPMTNLTDTISVADIAAWRATGWEASFGRWQDDAPPLETACAIMDAELQPVAWAVTPEAAAVIVKALDFYDETIRQVQEDLP